MEPHDCEHEFPDHSVLSAAEAMRVIYYWEIILDRKPHQCMAGWRGVPIADLPSTELEKPMRKHVQITEPGTATHLALAVLLDVVESIRVGEVVVFPCSNENQEYEVTVTKTTPQKHAGA